MHVFQMLVRTIGDIEVEITRAQSLRTKFSGNEKEACQVVSNDVDDFITQLLEQPEVVVTDGSKGPIGTVIHNLFAAAQKVCTILCHICYSKTRGDANITSQDKSHSLLLVFKSGGLSI